MTSTYIHPDSVRVSDPEQIDSGYWRVRVRVDGRLWIDDVFLTEQEAIAAVEHYSEGLR